MGKRICNLCHKGYRRLYKAKDYCYFCHRKKYWDDPRYVKFRKKVLKNHSRNWCARNPVAKAEYSRNYYYSVQLLNKKIKKLTLKTLKEESEHFFKTKIPRCLFCKKDYEKFDKYNWKPNCECIKGKIRVSIG